MSHRGLVIAPEVTAMPSKAFMEIRGGGAERLETQIRRCLPYWDTFDNPVNRIVSLNPSPNLAYLQEIGVLQRSEPKVEFRGDLSQLWIAHQIAALQAHEASEPGCWAICQEGSHVWFPPEVTSPTRSAEVTLYESLPVPGDDVSFEDILNFKFRRKDELIALRIELDALYLGIIDSKDIPRAETAALARLSRALTDIDRVTKEAWTSRLISSLTVEIGLGLAAIAWAGVGVAVELGLPAAAGAAAGAVLGTIKLDLRQGSRLAALPADTANLMYAHSVGKQIS